MRAYVKRGLHKTCMLCDLPHSCKGYCTKHYQRLCRYGDATVCKVTPRHLNPNPPRANGKQLSGTKESRFLVFIDKRADCWMWTGKKDPNGYGRMSFAGERLAHRASYRHFVGDIPVGAFLCHKCDVPACVNPAHLFIGTQLDNMRDAVRKGRQSRGDSHGNAKLTTEIALAIKARVSAGETRAAVAKDIGISRATVSMVASGKRWGHLAHL